MIWAVVIIARVSVNMMILRVLASCHLEVSISQSLSSWSRRLGWSMLVTAFVLVGVEAI